MGKKHQPKSEPETVDQAISGLVKTLKRDLQKKYGRVNYQQLRRDGFSDMLLARLKQT